MSHYTVIKTCVEKYDEGLLRQALNKVLNVSEFEGMSLETKDGMFVIRHPQLEKYREQNLRFVRGADGKYEGEVDYFLVKNFAEQVIGRVNQEYVVGATRKVLQKSGTIRERVNGKSRQLIVNQR